MNIPLERIAPADYARELSESTIESLMHSIERLGLLQPIIVMQAKINRGVLCDGWRIVAGHHRFEACRRLGMSEIDATVMPNVSYLETELIEIDENLCRAELSAAQRAAAIKRRKQIWEALNPETGGTNCPTSLADGRKAGSQHLQQFAADTANTTGESKRDINRHLARADALGDDLQAVSGTSLDKGVELDALKTLPANERQALIARARKGEAVSARKATAHLRLTIEYRDVHDGAVSLARSIMKRDRDLALALRDVLDTQLMEAL